MNQRRFWLLFLLVMALAAAIIGVILTRPNVTAVIPVAVTATPPTTQSQLQQQQILAAIRAQKAINDLQREGAKKLFRPVRAEPATSAP